MCQNIKNNCGCDSKRLVVNTFQDVVDNIATADKVIQRLDDVQVQANQASKDVRDFQEFIDGQGLDTRISTEVTEQIVEKVNDGIIQDEISTQVQAIQDEYAPRLGTIEKNMFSYISIGDSLKGGTLDNKALIEATVQECKTQGKGLYIPKGVYYVSDNLTIEGLTHIWIDGEVKLVEGKRLNLVNNSLGSPADWSIYNVSGGILRMSGLNSSIVRVVKATTLELYALGDVTTQEFTAYNTFTLGKINTFRILSEGTKAGWINENKFYGGRFNSLTIDGNFSHDNNIFYGTMMEGITMNINRGISNYFYDVRMEGTNTINFGALASNNVIQRSWVETPYSYLRDSVTLTKNDLGMNNNVVCTLDTFYRKEVFFDLNNRSKNYSLQNLYPTSSGLTIVRGGAVLYESELIPLKTPFGIVLKSDVSKFFIHMYAYDENKNLLLTEQVNFTSLAGGVFNSTTGAYTFDNFVGAGQTGIPMIPNGIVKYIRYRVTSGTATNDVPFNYLKLIKIESEDTHNTLVSQNNTSQLTSNSLPSQGYFKQGDIVWSSMYTDNTFSFYRRLTNGESHTIDVDWIKA